jgi:hypothetical protein
MTIHQERTHPEFVDGCYGCKLTTINLSAAGVKMERIGKDVTGGRGTRRYVQDMYARARAAGKPDPVPDNAEAAAFAPAAGVVRPKNYKANNGGL